MNKFVKIILLIITFLLGIIILDTLQARIFKRSPIISWQEDLSWDSWVDRGLLMDTYYCSESYDLMLVNWKIKGSKYTCPINESKLYKYDFSVTVNSKTKYEKTFAFEHNGTNYYYGNTDFTLYLKRVNSNDKYNISTAIINELVDFNDILSQSKTSEIYRDGGSKLYQYNQFNIIVCNTIEGNNDVIIGDTEMQIGNFCNTNKER